MSMLIKSDTPSEAPVVRKMLLGSEGYPSRANDLLATGQHQKGLLITLYETCYALADKWDALTMRISTD